jgi:hypothetical protein
MAPQLTTEQKTRIVEWFLQTDSIVTVQVWFKNQYKCKEAPARNTVKMLVEQFRATGNVAGKKRGGSKPRVRTHDTVGTIHAGVASSPARKSVRQLALENEVSPTTAWSIIRTDLRMHRTRSMSSSLRQLCAEKSGQGLRRNSIITCSRTLTIWNTFGFKSVWLLLLELSAGQSIQQCSPNSARTEGQDQGKLCTGHKRNAHRVLQNFVLRLQAVWESQGAHIEHVIHNATHMWNSNPGLLLWHCFHINKFAIANSLLSWKWR